MKKGVLKIRPNGRRELKIEGKEQSIPKEFDTDPLKGDEVKSLDCEVEVIDNKITRIIVNGQDVSKNTAIIGQKANAEKAKKMEEERAKEEKEREEAYNKKYHGSPPDIFSENSAAFANVDIRKVLANVGASASFQVDNFALKLNTLARYESESDKIKFVFFKTDRKGKLFQIRANFGNFNFQQHAEKQQALAKSMFGENCGTDNFAPHSRLIVGLGGASVYEVSMTLHHIYGIPYIPASSIKGVLRSYIIQEIFENKEEEALQNDKNFCKIFGCPAKRALTNKKGEATAFEGEVVFFDAYPTREPEKDEIKPDVMTVHYQDYYSKDETYPTDTQKTNPIPFLTIEKTPFQFILGAKTDILNQKLWKDKTLLQLLHEALEKNGIGAKTAVGYGYFK